MDPNIDYILDKKELQSLLKRTVEIKKYKSGYVQFVTKGVKDFIYYSFNIADILNIKVNKKLTRKIIGYRTETVTQYVRC